MRFYKRISVSIALNNVVIRFKTEIKEIILQEIAKMKFLVARNTLHSKKDNHHVTEKTTNPKKDMRIIKTTIIINSKLEEIGELK